MGYGSTASGNILPSWDVNRTLEWSRFGLFLIIFLGKLFIFLSRQIPDLQTHIEVNMRNRQQNVQNVAWAVERISCVFQEHHCLISDEPMPAPAEVHGWGEDVLNVWLPPRLKIEHEAVGFFPPFGAEYFF
jgi:hypothetical protein